MRPLRTIPAMLAVIAAAGAGTALATTSATAAPTTAPSTSASAQPSASSSASPSVRPSGSPSGRPSASAPSHRPAADGGEFHGSVTANNVALHRGGDGVLRGTLTFTVTNGGGTADNGIHVGFLPPEGATIDPYGITGPLVTCLPAVAGHDELGEKDCAVNDTVAPGASVTGTVTVLVHGTIPTGPGSVTAFHGMNGFPVGNAASTTYCVFQQGSEPPPSSPVHIRLTATDPVPVSRVHSQFHGDVAITVDNDGGAPVDDLRWMFFPPKGYTVDPIGQSAVLENCGPVRSNDPSLGTGIGCDSETRAGQHVAITIGVTSVGVPPVHAAADQGTGLATTDAIWHGYHVPFGAEPHSAPFRLVYAKGSGTSPTAAGGTGGGSGLPVTGMPVGLLAGTGAVLLAAGAVALTLIRRRALRSA